MSMPTTYIAINYSKLWSFKSLRFLSGWGVPLDGNLVGIADNILKVLATLLVNMGKLIMS